MFLNTFVQKHINSKYYIIYCSCVIWFFPCGVLGKALPATQIFHNTNAVTWYSGQICKPVDLY